MPGSLLELLLHLAKLAWGVLVLISLLGLFSSLPGERPMILGRLFLLALAAVAYLVPFRRWRERRAAVSELAPTAAPPEPASSGESLAEVLAWLGIPLETGAGTAEGALSGALAKTTIYQAYRAVAARRPGEAVRMLRPLLEEPGLDPHVAGAAHYVLSAAWVQFGEREPIVHHLSLARELYPSNPTIEKAWQRLPAMFPSEVAEPGFYAPSLEGARELRRHALGADHFAILRLHPSPEQQSGSVKFLYTLAVHANGDGKSVLYVASEHNRMYSPEREGSQSHFLGVFPGQGHTNLGASNDWADLAKFEARALEVARDHLGLTG